MGKALPKEIDLYLRFSLIPIPPPSLSVNRHNGLWHCFGCGRGGDAQKLLEDWQAR